MSIGRSMIKEDVVYIQTIEYYLATKWKEILTSALTWIKLEDTNAKWNKPETERQILHNLGGIQNKLIGTESRMLVSRAWRAREWEDTG